MVRTWPGLLVLLLVLGVVLGAPGLLLAAGGGDILSPRFDLTIWSIIVFVALLWVLRKFAWGPMLEGLQKREKSIETALTEAGLAREEAQRLRDQLQGEVNKAHEKVREILDEARRDAQHTSEEILAKTRAEIQAERDRMRREITIAREQALQELWAQSAQLATLISAKAIRRSLNETDHRSLVDEAVAELRSAAGKKRQA
jgi:F-type H+-transporting ATPase subunit b